jgi:hypothetical protein
MVEEIIKKKDPRLSGLVRRNPTGGGALSQCGWCHMKESGGARQIQRLRNRGASSPFSDHRAHATEVLS